MYRFLTLAALLVMCSPAHAWLRMSYEDAVIVERSELIVVAKIKAGSITCVMHDKTEHGGSSWEHHATLLISDVIKGKLTEKEIPIIIYYGLDAIVGGIKVKDNKAMFNFGRDVKIPPERIDLYDSGNSHMSLEPFVTGLNDDQLWFLRKRSGIYGREPGNGNFGIADPEDVQPLKLKQYFACYLSANSEKDVSAYVAAHPECAARTERYIDHMAIQRILKLPDAGERAKQLLPYFLKWHYWSNGGCEAKDGLIACGDVGGVILFAPFRDPAYQKRRGDMMSIWAALKYKGAVEELTKLLIEHDAFWGKQDLSGDWWNAQGKLADERRDFYGDVYHAAHALSQINDPRAKDAISLTLKRWSSITFSNPQIREECERALQKW